MRYVFREPMMGFLKHTPRAQQPSPNAFIGFDGNKQTSSSKWAAARANLARAKPRLGCTHSSCWSRAWHVVKGNHASMCAIARGLPCEASDQASVAWHTCQDMSSLSASVCVHHSANLARQEKKAVAANWYERSGFLHMSTP
jgi:hypothetical protein